MARAAKRVKVTTTAMVPYKARISRNPGGMVVSRYQSFPKVYKTQMTIGRRLNFATNSSGEYVVVLKANSLFNPVYTPTTPDQPLYFDQLMAIYDHYQVVSSRVTFEMLDATTTDTTNEDQDGITLVISQGDDISPPSTLAEHLARPRAKWRIADAAHGFYPRLSHSYSEKATFGSKLPSSDLRGTATTDPAELTTFFIFMQAGLNSVIASSSFIVTMKFDVIFTELRNVAPSTAG